METLQQQLTVVNAKIEAIHQKIEVISAQISELLVSVRQNGEPTLGEGDHPLLQSAPATELHRDVLVDQEPKALNSSKGQPISHELQMQRLMAQLTAAYNRIAALEEQLLSQRIH